MPSLPALRNTACRPSTSRCGILFQAGLVNYETALENASNADDFKLRMQGIASTADISRQSMQSAGFGGR